MSGFEQEPDLGRKEARLWFETGLSVAEPGEDGAGSLIGSELPRATRIGVNKRVKK
jgi:hypothetical protein